MSAGGRRQYVWEEIDTYRVRPKVDLGVRCRPFWKSLHQVVSTLIVNQHVDAGRSQCSRAHSLLEPNLSNLPHLSSHLRSGIGSSALRLIRHGRDERLLIRNHGTVLERAQGGELLQVRVKGAILGLGIRVPSLNGHVDVEHVDVCVPRPLVEGGAIRVWVYGARKPTGAVEEGFAWSSWHVDGCWGFVRVVPRLFWFLDEQP